MNQDTICALATANGVGAVGMIRLSGPQCISVVEKCFTGKKLSSADSHTVHYGHIVYDGEVVDEVMVAVLRAPKTFTAEDSVEISFHGSPHIAKKLLEVLVNCGARMAKAGEFTLRAFLNGRIDLSQAEAIADLIASENEASRKVALNQLRGGISEEIGALRTDLLNFTSLIELELDFSEEDVEFADRTALQMLVTKIEEKLRALLDSFQYGNAIKKGVEVAIIGKPNAGKSTLLNALLKEDRAIVSDIAGTTRDTIEEVLTIEGTAFRFIDTAGIRETSDSIEAIGVQKAMEKLHAAQIVLYLYDEFDSTPEEVIQFVNEVARPDLKIVLLHNKMDKAVVGDPFDEALRRELMPHVVSALVPISAKEQQGIEEVKKELASYIDGMKQESNVIITNQRHYEALHKALEAINYVQQALDNRFSTDLLAYELRYALEYLGEISGAVTNDEILGNIFSKFCIGK